MRPIPVLLAVGLSAILAAASCTSVANPSPSAALASPSGSVVTATAAPTPAPTPEPTVTPAPTESLTETFPRDSFSDPTTVDNNWFPLVPGSRLTFEGATNGDEGERIPHRVEFTITDMIKVLDGVRTVVGYELDFSDGELVEAELAFWAQDDDGTVWHLGQYPEEYEEGSISDTPAWIAGIADAKAGISMKAEPMFGGLSYSQGWGPAVSWTDRARVFDMGTATCVPAGCYDDVLVIDEFNRDEPDAHQLKYYAPGIGNVRVGWAGALEKDQEVLELIEVTELGSGDLMKLRETILAMEKRAYELSKDVYGGTAPMEPAG
jgi:hypothetical protein